MSAYNPINPFDRGGMIVMSLSVFPVVFLSYTTIKNENSSEPCTLLTFDTKCLIYKSRLILLTLLIVLLHHALQWHKEKENQRTTLSRGSRSEKDHKKDILKSVKAEGFIITWNNFLKEEITN